MLLNVQCFLQKCEAQMTRLYAREKQCKRLFNVKTPPEKQSYIAVSCTGELLLVTEELAGMVLHYGEITYFRLDHLELSRNVQSENTQNL